MTMSNNRQISLLADEQPVLLHHTQNGSYVDLVEAGIASLIVLVLMLSVEKQKTVETLCSNP